MEENSLYEIIPCEDTNFQSISLSLSVVYLEYHVKKTTGYTRLLLMGQIGT